MKIAIDARELSVNRPGGLRTYAESVVEGLGTYSDGHELIIYLDRDLPATMRLPAGLVAEVCGPSQLALREQFLLPRRLHAAGVQLCHFLANTAPIRLKMPYVLTLHDLFCLQRPVSDIITKGSLHNKGISLYCKFIPWIAARRARRIVTVSQYSAQCISDVLKRTDIVVVPQSIHPRYRPVPAGELRQSILKRLGVSRLVMVLGSMEPRKNLATVLRAFAKVNARAKEIGMVVTWPASGGFEQWATEHAGMVPERVAVMPCVDDEELVRLYCAADVFLFASCDEGFGLPVVEAMACGCPVITSDASCLPETAGGAAVLTNPQNPETIAAAVLELVDDIAKRNRLRELGFARARYFSAENTTMKLLELYAECVDGVSSASNAGRI